MKKKMNNEKAKVNLGIMGTILAGFGLFIFGLPLGITAVVLGLLDNPKNTWSYTAIVTGAAVVAAVVIAAGM